MTLLSKKIDFVVIFKVKSANPNGDPLNENMPRTLADGIGEVTDVCIKRKIRNRLLDMNKDIFVQSDDYKKDKYSSLQERANEEIGKISETSDFSTKACEKWMDVRAFGQVFAYEKGSSIGIRGPVTIRTAFSKEPIIVISDQITKSVNGKINKKGNDSDDEGMTSDRMGMKHWIREAIYVFYGAMNPQLAEKTAFTDEDAKDIKDVLPKLFEKDASSARPEGSMEILKVIWFEHNSPAGQYSSAKVHGSIKIDNSGNIENEKDLENGTVESIKGLKAEIIQGW
ncbi:type I-C CRISPR-associated protein Cas7/Csd2 [Endomicrobiia bacterium]|nr:type I-C CRISPR-associated protein Cas7/Csd2 [Endomicrobiia bacterium]GHT14570.1 type I-C CRISPR-associated protein Cas7/Csd2 [Endomicrobiia bacterium]GHT20158.1 type I-C CRISPR-associated protein Cas7/Csd2 [Endomicrobiia bacterium]GHT30387.1 type I-C CRISPR-associated protein Cas7/Csd2 [Endomicrobiia bacterium]